MKGDNIIWIDYSKVVPEQGLRIKLDLSSDPKMLYEFKYDSYVNLLRLIIKKTL